MNRLPPVPRVDVVTAQTRLEAAGEPPAVLLDVREPEDFRVVRAPGAVLRPVSTLHLTIDDLPRDRPIFVICYEGNTSQAVTAFMLRRGWTDVASVDGGMSAWRRAGLPIRQGPPEPGEGELELEP